jgi:hypothetical protein
MHKLKPIFTDYIYHQNEKSKPSKKDLPLLKNDITKFRSADIYIFIAVISYFMNALSNNSRLYKIKCRILSDPAFF